MLLRPGVLALAALAIALAGCGGGDGSGAESPFERVHFRAADGVLLDGRGFGSGRVGVVLVHVGRPGDTQADWAGLARLLTDKGYLVLTYDRRGVCPRAGAGCSRGTRRLRVLVAGRRSSRRGTISTEEPTPRASVRLGPRRRLELTPGSDHGTDLLRAGSPLRERTEKLIVRYVDEAAG